jgi:hypothetical protein
MLIFILIFIILYLYGVGLYFTFEFISEGKWEWSLLLWPLFFLVLEPGEENHDNLDN